MMRSRAGRSSESTLLNSFFHPRPTICSKCNKVKKAGRCACPSPLDLDFDKLTPKEMNRRQKFWHYSGKILAAILAIASGVTTAAAFVSLNMVSAGAPMIILAVLVFLAGFAANWYIFRTSTPRMLVKAFGQGWPFETLMKKDMSTRRKIAMGIAIVLSLCAGFTTAALTSSSALSLTVALGISAAFPPLAILLFTVSFICLSSTLLYNFQPLIINPNPKKSIRDFLDKLFSIDPKFQHNCIDGDPGRPKPPWRLQLERVFKVLVALTIVGLAGFGLFMTMSASAAGFKTSILRVVPDASIKAVEIAGKIICLGGALLGRIPFTVRNIFKSLAKVFTSDGYDLSVKFGNANPSSELMESARRDLRPIMTIGTDNIVIYGRQKDGLWKLTSIPRTQLSEAERRYLGTFTSQLNVTDCLLKSPDFFQTSLLSILETERDGVRGHTPDIHLYPPSLKDKFLYILKAGSLYLLALGNAVGNGFISAMTGGGSASIIGGTVVSATAGVASMSFSKPPPKVPPESPPPSAEPPVGWQPFQGKYYKLRGGPTFHSRTPVVRLSSDVSREDASLTGRPAALGSGWRRRRSSQSIRML